VGGEDHGPVGSGGIETVRVRFGQRTIGERDAAHRADGTAARFARPARRAAGPTPGPDHPGTITRSTWDGREAAAMDAAPHHEAVMSGHGYYNRHSVLQAAAAEFGLTALRAAAAVAPIRPAPQPLVVADYGCSQGQNSLVPMGAAVAGLRARTDLPVTVVHTDLPGNDFSSVFEVLSHDPTSYLTVDGHAYALAAGRSFYEEVMPPGSVALGWSSVTTHWLSALPGPVPGHFTAQAGADPAIRAQFAARAAEDWTAFVAARAAELTPGAHLVMVEPCAHPDGRIGSEPLMDLMDQVLAELVAARRVTTAPADATKLPVWMRTPDEYAAAVDARPDLEFADLRVAEARSPLWAQYEQHGDGAAYAGSSTASMRAWSEAMLADTIDDPAVLDAFYDRCRELGTAEPARMHVQVFHVVMDIARR
jgi:hypothetical protein